MLNEAMKEKLKTLFHALQPTVSLAVAPSLHPKQKELLAMLEDVASTSDHVTLEVTGEPTEIPQFTLRRDGETTGITFAGVPGGHEFSSLVLAILNSAGLGRLPDKGVIERIRRLESGLDIRTYVSLTCENCPDVVQALNQICLAHGAIRHTMVEGSLIPDQLSKLNIQGVPSVLVNGQLLHSGRASLSDLLTKLENKYPAEPEGEGLATFLGYADVAIVGGGPAGAAAAIYCARKGLKTVLIMEKMGGQVQETKGIENFISVTYIEGPELTRNLDQHLRSYPIEIFEHRRVERIANGKKKTVYMTSGEYLTTDSVIIATGAKWREIGVPGEKQYLGRGVAYCPHCEGPFYKEKKVAVIGGGNSGVEAAIDLSRICREVVLMEYENMLKADDVLVKKLNSLANVSVITGAKTDSINGNNEKVVGLTYEDRKTKQENHLELDGVFVQIGLTPNSAFVKDLVETNSFGEIVVDVNGRTSIPGIYAAGDVTTVPFKQVVIAIGEGAKVALTAYKDRLEDPG